MWLLACSGPGAAAIIIGNITFSRCLALIVGLLAIVSLVMWALFSHRARYPIICVLLLPLHPAWTMSASRGDCGEVMVLGSMLSMVIASIAVITQAISVMRANRGGGSCFISSGGE